MCWSWAAVPKRINFNTSRQIVKAIHHEMRRRSKTDKKARAMIKVPGRRERTGEQVLAEWSDSDQRL
jgi:hypothetical protein